ncbi:MAG TPA: helix-turn-helix domain-containing protein [Clostridium perfringens]|nr:helix-turn-helix domain-containing protein [Clostridium perfringens]
MNISLDLGFDDCGYFIRVFKKITGLTPKAFREE